MRGLQGASRSAVAPLAMQLRPIAAIWTLAFALFTVLGAITYARVLSHDGSSHWLLPVLTPGFGLYVLLVGSLLFGRGFGQAGDAAVFVGGSAAAWARVEGRARHPVGEAPKHRSTAPAHQRIAATLAPNWHPTGITQNQQWTLG